MNRGHKVRIRTSGVMKTEAWIDGRKVERLRRVEFVHGYDGVPEITITFIPLEAEIDIEASGEYETRRGGDDA